MSLASSSEALTLPVMKVSLERCVKRARPDRPYSLTTTRTLSMRATVCSTRRRSASLRHRAGQQHLAVVAGDVDVIWSLAMSRMRAAPRSSMPWSSSCAPEVRRSVATMAADDGRAADHQRHAAA